MQLEKIEGFSDTTFMVKGSLSGMGDFAIKLFNAINSEIENSDNPILLDMREISFIDSIAIGLIVGVMVKARGSRKKVKMINVPDHLAQVFETVHLKMAFPQAY